MSSSPWRLFVAACALAVLGGPATAQTTARITGTATYRERIALTPRAVFVATLEDVSRADAPSEEIARVRREGPGQVPISFEIPYDPRRIDSRRSYHVRAAIHEGDRLTFVTDRATPVLTHGQGSRVSLLMRQARTGEAGPGAAGGASGTGGSVTVGPLPATYMGLLPCADCMGIRYQINLLPRGAYMQRASYLRDGHDDSYYEIGSWSAAADGRTLTLRGGRGGASMWAVQDARTLRKLDLAGNPIESELAYELNRLMAVAPMEPRVRMTGMFRYYADAARFRDCASGLEWPVAMRDDYLSLERAYTESKRGAGAELPVTLQARIEPLPRMEGEGTQPTLVVEDFVGTMAGKSCDDMRSIGLEDTRWRPIRIGNRTVTITGQQREPWIVLESRSKRASGSGGCNRFSGTYEVGKGTLKLGPLVSTKMACLEPNYEDAFFIALDQTRRYKVSGRSLELLDANGKVLARLEERNLR